jgi:LPXTG-motif cell wall-anchored protein
MKRMLVVVFVGLLGLLLAVSPSVAQVGVISIPLSTVVRDDPGTVTQLGIAEVPPDLVGRTCVGRLQSENQTSVHPGNNLVVNTGDQAEVIPDVEGQMGAVLVFTGPLTLGPTISVDLIMGSDGTFSGGLLGFFVDCPPPETTTTTTTTTTSTTTTSTTTTTTTTTTVPPTVTIPPPSVSQTTGVPPTTLPETGRRSSEPAALAGLTLLTGGVFLVVLVEFRRRSAGSRKG